MVIFFFGGTSTHIAKSITVPTDVNAVFFSLFFLKQAWKNLRPQNFLQLLTIIVTWQSMIGEEKIVGLSVNDD